MSADPLALLEHVPLHLRSTTFCQDAVSSYGLNLAHVPEYLGKRNQTDDQDDAMPTPSDQEAKCQHFLASLKQKDRYNGGNLADIPPPSRRRMAASGQASSSCCQS